MEFDKWVRDIPSYVDEIEHHDPQLYKAEKEKFGSDDIVGYDLFFYFMYNMKITKESKK